MMKRTFVFLYLLVLFFPLNVLGADSQTLSVEAEESCRQSVLNAAGSDLTRLNPNDIVSACQGFPLSDDIFVQVLGALIGPEIVSILDIYTGLTGKPHGFDLESPLFMVASPLHDVLAAANYFLLTVLLIGVSFSFFAQALRWQKGDFKEKIFDWTSREGVSKGVSIFLSVPVFGWMTPLQAAAILIILLLGFLTKYVVTFLFLASFFGSVGTEVKNEVSDELQVSFGETIMMYQCDIERREKLITGIQSHLNSSSKEKLDSNPIYQCLTTSGANSNLVRRPDPSANTIGFHYVPATLMQAQNCIDRHRQALNEWGVEIPATCGAIQFELPNNQAAPGSIQNAVDLYASSTVSLAQRELALKVNEFECRTGGGVPDYQGEVVASCLKAQRSGDGYSYQYSSDPITTELKLTYFNTALTQTSRESFSQSVKEDLAQVNAQIGLNTSALLAHLTDLMAPFNDEEALPAGLQARRDDLVARMQERLDSTGTLGVSENDVNFLVDNIQRGAWTSSSLFFGSLSDDIEEAKVIDSLQSVYSVVTPYSSRGFGSELLMLKDMQGISGDGSLADYVSEKVGFNLIIPRLGLYLDNVDCWHQQTDCTTPPLNPFSHLSTRGAELIDKTAYVIVGAEILQKLATRILGFSKDENTKKRPRFMIIDTLQDFQWLYLIIGIVLAIVIPLIPMLKLLAMLINWAYDVIRELLGLQMKISLSPFGDHGQEFVPEEVRESFTRLVGLGLYFLFVIVGLIATFLMFSFLFAMNVFLVGILSSIVNWGVTTSSIEELMLNAIFDVIIAFLLVYEIHKCTPYMEKIPKAMAEHFSIQLSPSDSLVQQMFMYVKGYVAPGVSSFLHGK